LCAPVDSFCVTNPNSQVGSSQHGFSDTFKFTSAPDATTVAAQFPLRFGVWGDMGVSNAQILASVKSEVAHDNFDMILHVGDLAYDLHNDDGHNGDKFMDSIQEMAAVVPYMTDVGNHEQGTWPDWLRAVQTREQGCCCVVVLGRSFHATSEAKACSFEPKTRVSSPISRLGPVVLCYSPEIACDGAPSQPIARSGAYRSPGVLLAGPSRLF